MKTRILQATCLATQEHCMNPRKEENAFRKDSSLPYIIHPLHVFRVVSEWGVIDIDTLVACVCHDLLEDTLCGEWKLAEAIGQTAFGYVKELTHIPPPGLTPQQAAAMKADKINTFSTASIPALIVKVADRLVNVLDFYKSNSDYAVKYMHKGQPIFNAFANRKNEIDDFCNTDFFDKAASPILYLSLRIQKSIDSVWAYIHGHGPHPAI